MYFALPFLATPPLGSVTRDFCRSLLVRSLLLRSSSSPLVTSFLAPVFVLLSLVLLAYSVDCVGHRRFACRGYFPRGLGPCWLLDRVLYSLSFRSLVGFAEQLAVRIFVSPVGYFLCQSSIRFGGQRPVCLLTVVVYFFGLLSYNVGTMLFTRLRPCFLPQLLNLHRLLGCCQFTWLLLL